MLLKMYSLKIVKVGQCLYLRNAITGNETELNMYFNLTAKLRPILYVSHPQKGASDLQEIRVN
jgi:hypothetical protein